MYDILKYYSRKDVQKELLKIAKDREVGVRYGENFGKRPDILQFESDIKELAKQGATSFHISIERWKNPLDLKSGLSRKQLDEMRSGFDIVIDIDSKFIEHSKIAASLIIDALKFNELKNVPTKYSGATGVHIFIPFESFPKKVNGTETRLLFPEVPIAISNYLKDLIEPYLREQILSVSTVNEISESTKIPLNKFIKNNQLYPYAILEIDSHLVSSRHMIRSIYSVNEKSNLVSIPIDIDHIKKFTPREAKIQNVEVKKDFIDPEKSEPEEAKQLFIQAFDYSLKQKKIYVIKNVEYEIPKVEISDKFFPECISKLLSGIKEDGRKRAVFILISFLQHMGWSYDKIQNTLLEWNKKNYEPLKEGYILAQIRWFKRQTKKILPPNCDHETYYKNLGVYCATCKWKNPVKFVQVKVRGDKNKSKNRR